VELELSTGATYTGAAELELSTGVTYTGAATEVVVGATYVEVGVGAT